MKKLLALLGLMLALCGLLPCPAIAEQPVNLLENGGFESLNAAGDPVDWYETAYRSEAGYSRMSVTSERAHDGQYSVLLENANSNDARFTCTVRVKPRKLYRLSGYVLIEKMEEQGNGANLAIEDIYAFSECLYDTGEAWKQIEWYGETGENQTELTIGVRVGGYSAESIGKAYFDDIVLEEVASLPAGVTADIWYNTRPAEPAKVEDESDGAKKSTTLFVLCAIVFLFLYLLAKPLLHKQGNRLAIWGFGALLLVALMGRVIIAWKVPGYQVDINCFTAWSLRMAEVGPQGFYAQGYFCDYPPGYMLLLWPIGFLLKAVDYIANPGAALLIVKIMPILCDMLGAICLFVFAKKRINSVTAAFLAALYLLSPATLVNGAAWGQVDSLLALLMLFAALYAMERKWHIALPVFAVAALMKPQALLFGPIGGIWLISCLWSKQDRAERQKQWKNIAIGSAVAVAAALLIILPFSVRQESAFGWLFELYGQTLSSYAFATLNTANLYYLVGANWTDLSAAIPTLLSVAAAVVFALIGGGILCRRHLKKQAFEFKNKQVQIALLSLLFAAFQVALSLFSATYTIFGYSMMVYVFAYACVSMLADKRAELLPFYMSLALIGVYVLGVKIHERYLFPALLLLLMSYATTKDKRLLTVFAGFSATTFINTAIVLDNSILFGSAQGHLNPDTMALNIILCVLNLLLCGYAGWIALSGVRVAVQEPVLQEKEEPAYHIPPAYEAMLLHPKDARLRLTLRDWLIMGVTTALYAVLAFANLGSTVAPQDGWISSSPNEQIIFELDQSQTFSMQYYGGVSDNDFSIAVSEDGQNWSVDFPCRMKAGLCYRWNYAVQSEWIDEKVTYADSSPSTVLWLKGKYLRLNATVAGLNLFEIALLDTEGNNIPLTVASHTGANADMLAEAKPAENLINEQDTRIGEPGWYTGTYFDEVYHVRSAYEHLHAEKKAPFEWTHPPLGKLMIAAGIGVFGMTPFGWRFAGALIGVLMLPALYLLAKQISRRRSVATVSMLAFALDLMHYTQTRIATIDSFPVFFIILSYLCMARYMQFDVFAVAPHEETRLLNKAFWRSLIPLALSGLFMGLSIASKWIGMYSAIGLAILFFISIYRHFRVGNIAFSYLPENAADESKPRITGAQEFTLKRIFITCGFCVLFFILVPALIYYLSYIPHLAPTGPVTIRRIAEVQQRMLAYHATPGLGMDHAYHSPWWQWPFILKPMWFALDQFEPAGYASTIMCMGNPWVFYIGAVCMLALLLSLVVKYVGVRNGELVPKAGDGNLMIVLIGIGFLAQYLPWVLVPRGMYMYHYFASVPFIILATAWLMDLIAQKQPKLGVGVMITYLLGAAVFFALFFPYASGWLTSKEWLDAVKWFPRIYY